MNAQLAARRVTVALVLLLLVALAAPAIAARGTFTDSRTGLTWVSDPQFAVHTGFAPVTTMKRSRALALVDAMNRGQLPNFGRSDWRLPTRRELLARHPAVPGALPPPASDRIIALPVAGSATLAGVGEVSVLATNSALLAKNSTIGGNVVVNDAAPGATLQAGFELTVNANTLLSGAVAAHRLRLDPGSAVSGDASYNTKTGTGTVAGALHTPLALPVFALLPAFHTSAPRAGSPNVVVAAGQTVVLPAGEYGLLDVAIHGTLVLSGGQYDVGGVLLREANGCASPCASLRFAAATDLRLTNRFEAGQFSFIAPQAGSGIDANAVVVYVGGINGTTGALGATPPAAHMGKGGTLRANLYAPNGSVLIDRESAVRGSLFGRDVKVDQNSTVALSSFFANRAPIANPQTVVTNGAGPIVITLTGSDPESQDLRFAIVTGPTQGSLDPVAEGPEPTPNCPRPDPGTCIPNRTQATVTYRPATAGDVEDSFVFKVTDPFGASGQATVKINPGDDTLPPPPPTTVVVPDISVNAFRDHDAVVTLTGNAPDGVELTFAVVAGSGPASGTLSPLVPGAETPRRSSSTTYTPASGFVGSDGFQFTACGIISSVTVCDTGNVTITVTEPIVEPTQLAPDIAASTVENRAVEVTLGETSSGATAAAGLLLHGRIRLAAFLDSAEMAGNVADADNNGFGDNHNDLPGAAPVFISAAVGQVGGGAGSNGTSRVHIEWDLSSLGGGGGLTSANVVLHTHRGTIDSLDTAFFAGAGGNGTLEDTDFQSTLEAVGATMPVPSLSEQPVGEDGTFSFDVLGELQAALRAGAPFFTVQGRVNETLAGPARGLEVRSTADSNVADFLQPQLEITTPGATPPPEFTVLTLPLHGVLRDSLGVVIETVPFLLAGAQVSYTPDADFIGDDGFDYRAQFFDLEDFGRVSIRILVGDCLIDATFCDPGR